MTSGDFSAVLDVAFVPPNVSLEELLVTAFLAPLLNADLRAQPHLQLFATDASPASVGACSTPVSLELWTRLYDFSDEKGCSVRLGWDTGSMLPPEFRDSRAAVAGLVVDLPWVEGFSYRFRHPQHINLLELEALMSLIREPVDRGLGNRRVLCLVDSRVVLGSVCKGRSSSRRVNFRLRRLGGLLQANSLSLDLCWVPSWKNPSDAPSRFDSVSKWRAALPLFSRELHITPEALPEALVEVDRLLEPLSKGARPALKNLREKQAIPDTVTQIPSQQRRPRLRLTMSRDMMRNQVSTTPSKEIDGKHEWVDVANERMRAETVAHVLPKHVPDLVTDVPKNNTIRNKGHFDADTESNILTSHILAKRDRVAANGEYDISAQVLTQDVQQSVGVASPCSVLVTLNLTQVHLRPGLEEENSSLLTSPLEPWQSSAVPSTLSTFTLL